MKFAAQYGLQPNLSFDETILRTRKAGYLCNENRMEKTGVPSEEYLEGELAYMKSLV